MADAVPAREGVGLRNTRERLAQLYGADGRLALRPAEGGGVEAEVSLPWRAAEGAAAAPSPSPAQALAG
jgi:signal transduction histidine kinase